MRTPWERSASSHSQRTRSAQSLHRTSSQLLWGVLAAQVPSAGQGVVPSPSKGLAQEKPNSRVSDCLGGEPCPPVK